MSVKIFLLNFLAIFIGDLIVNTIVCYRAKKAQEKVKIQSWNILEQGEVLENFDNGVERMRLVYFDNAVHMLLERDGYFADVVSFDIEDKKV